MTIVRTLGPSRRGLAPLQVNQRTDFGQGIGSALGGLGDAVNQYSVSQDAIEAAGINLEDAKKAANDALEDRARKVKRADLLVKYSRMQGDYLRAKIDFDNEYPADGQDYYQRSQGLLRKHTEGFLSQITDEDLRVEFAPRIAEFAATTDTSNYAEELKRQSDNYLVQATDLQTRAMNNILSGNSTYEDEIELIEEYLDNSPLPAATTDELRLTLRSTLQEADFTRQVGEEFADPNGIRGSHLAAGESPHGKVAAAGLPGYAAGFLGLLLQKEAEGRYDIMYSPEGQRLFDSYAEHPNQPTTINFGEHQGEQSSAAGGYQFIKATWDKAAAALGLTDFSPESQTRAAWWLAQQDYAANTGRNIELDLASGDPVKIESVRQALVGTWQALGSVSPVEFFNAVTMGQATPTGILEDPLYANVSFTRKVELMKAAEEQRTDNLKLAIERQNAQTQVMLAQFQDSITAGAVRQADLDRFVVNQALSAEQEMALNKHYQTVQTEQYEAEQFVSNIGDATHVFSTEDASEANSFYNRSQRDIIQGADQERLFSEFIPTIEHTGIVPEQALADLERMRNSMKLDEAQFAYRALAAINAQNELITPLGEELAADVTYYDLTAGRYKSEAQALEDIRTKNSPEMLQVREAAKVAIAKERKDNPQYFLPENIAAGVDPSWTLRSPSLAGGQRMALQADYMRLYEGEYFRYGNHAGTDEAVKALMRKEWGVSEIGGTSRMMRLPPEKAGYRPFLGSYDYIDTQVREELAIVEGQSYELLPDAQTRNEMGSGRPASYMVATSLPDGTMQLLYDEETSLPRRIAFESPTQRLSTADGQPVVDNIAASLESQKWQRQLTDLRARVDNSEVVAQMSVLMGEERNAYLRSLSAEQFREYTELQREFTSIISAPPKGYEEYLNTMKGPLEEMRDLLSVMR